MFLWILVMFLKLIWLQTSQQTWLKVKYGLRPAEYKYTVADINPNFVSFQKGLYSSRIPCLNTQFAELWGRKVILVQGQWEQSHAEAKGQEQLFVKRTSPHPSGRDFTAFEFTKNRSQEISEARADLWKDQRFLALAWELLLVMETSYNF